MKTQTIRDIFILTISDRADFGKVIERGAYPSLQAARDAGEIACRYHRDKADADEWCDPVADVQPVLFYETGPA